ncbi:MAG: hypothetical protein K8I27_00425 [Planctomycetes bacterium]|nr:hypothetical protein [Planctomycetota bacterium]
MRHIPVLAFLLLAACANGHAHDENGEHPDDVKEHRDQFRPREAQSDFLDIGKQAGIEWLSFVPEDQLDYPEYFEGLDRDQKRHLRLAPKGSDEQVLIQFDLPDGSKLWPVDWYGTELMAIDLPILQGFSVAISKAANPEELVLKVCEHRARSFGGGKRVSAGGSEAPGVSENDGYSKLYDASADNAPQYFYLARSLSGRLSGFTVILEWSSELADPIPANIDSMKQRAACVSVLKGISIKREIALEGSPKHKCTSTIEEQLAGTLRFPDGTANLPVSEDMLVRKIGGDSTIQIDGQGAEPWILIRRLDANAAEGDMRATLRRDTTFNRRLKVPSGKWSAGYVPEGAKLPIVCFDYDDKASENNLLGILKAGDELLTFEVVTTGIRDGTIRRAAKQAAIELLSRATSESATPSAPELDPLIGWNMGSMGRDD